MQAQALPVETILLDFRVPLHNSAYASYRHYRLVDINAEVRRGGGCNPTSDFKVVSVPQYAVVNSSSATTCSMLSLSLFAAQARLEFHLTKYLIPAII
jgi:hypothetical protein